MMEKVPNAPPGEYHDWQVPFVAAAYGCFCFKCTYAECTAGVLVCVFDGACAPKLVPRYVYDIFSCDFCAHRRLSIGVWLAAVICNAFLSPLP